MNRREAIVAGVVGAATGTLWAGGFGLVLNRHNPTLEVIGQRDDLLALLDTGSVRALFVVGEGMSDQLGSLLGIFRRRVDLVAGSKAGIATLQSRHPTRLRQASTFILDEPVGITFAPSSTSTTGPAVLRTELPGAMTIEFATHTHGAWRQDASVSQRWTIAISRNGHCCAVAPLLDDLAAHGLPGMAVGLAGNGNLDRLWDMLRVPLVAMNANHIPTSDAGVQPAKTIRIFAHDPIRLTFRQDGIAVSE
ncbi:MAG: hypothetical protein QM589_12190 [Thermomicrobiales bacterium]